VPCTASTRGGAGASTRVRVYARVHPIHHRVLVLLRTSGGTHHRITAWAPPCPTPFHPTPFHPTSFRPTPFHPAPRPAWRPFNGLSRRGAAVCHTGGGRLTVCSQHGYLSSRGGCQKRWHSLVNCDHGDSIRQVVDVRDLEVPRHLQQPPHRLCLRVQRFGNQVRRLRRALRARVLEEKPPPVWFDRTPPSQRRRGALGGAARDVRVRVEIMGPGKFRSVETSHSHFAS
jgi:hypothetical protein